MSDYLKRGNLMWEGSRMMLPEHLQALRERKNKVREDPPPALTEEELTEFGLIAHDSLHHTLEVKIIYWRDGFDHETAGIIDRIDGYASRFKIENKWIEVKELKRIERL
ncbi:YolD-like family protein [Salipaludibacillus sp. CUR1]|uniref:YolD-like family protein n=1 Tax=Salipaludibacillus sp. CUR1 TaxID=2820003 RepID=UPI001E498A8E|nr:YolD-like family protein [Salipaludibacillus sp. CUR1]MCE7794508.1 YolD-like family protein [Salipaludibacillus sp. CUR1]